MKQIIIVCLLTIGSYTQAQQKVIPLYNGPAPGSENWNWQEKENNNNLFHERLVYNVTEPTLTVFLPDTPVANGTAVIICPGGAFQILSIDQEGFDVARWLNKKGVTAFVLKYRLVHTLSDDPVKELMAKNPGAGSANKKFEDEVKPIVTMGIGDAKNAIQYVRKYAAEYKIAPDHIGLIGFSAGGTLAAGAAYSYTPENRPDFVAPIYPYLGDFDRTSIPKDAPPIFIAVAADDYFGFDKSSADLYKEWTASKHSAELHIYSKGGHGFGMKKQNLPSDSWIDRFGDWLQLLGYIKK